MISNFILKRQLNCGLCLNSLLWFGMVHSVLVIVNLVFGICAHILPSCHHPFELVEGNLSVLVLVVATKGRIQEVFVPVEFKTFLICLLLYLIYSYVGLVNVIAKESSSLKTSVSQLNSIYWFSSDATYFDRSFSFFVVMLID